MSLLTTHQQKALNFKRHISLTANAGSGKTFVLAHRYIEIALSEKGSLRKIAAITFTDKAAGELYKKIADYVEKRFDESDDVEEKKLLSGIRRRLVSANISTIHSFCIDILKQFPVDAGLDADFQPIDEVTADELIELSVEETIKESLSGDIDSDKTKYLIRIFGSKFILSSQLKYLIKARKKVFHLGEELYNQQEEKIAEHFYNDFCKSADRLIKINQEEFITALDEINETVLSANKDNERAPEIKKLLGDLKNEYTVEKKLGLIHSLKEFAFTTGGTVRKTGYLKNELRDGLTGEILISEKYVNELSQLNIPANHKEIERELAKFGKTILQLFNKTVEKYETKKKVDGYLDYEDILIRTRNLLKIPVVKSELSRQFKYIMVDEYQDTNEIQYRIFLPILDDLKTGNLFVVGDEKQSIYMFRDAELEVFRITKKNISDTSGEKYLLRLPDSFRMAPGICLFVNRLFRNLFSEPIEIFNEVQHSDLVCAVEESTESRIEIIIGAAEKKGEDSNNSERSEAELVAGRIISLVNGTGISKEFKWKDIAVLVRKRKSFATLEKIFIEKSIPFNIVGGKGFYQRQSVYDIYNYFSFLLDDKNDAALAGILRSPFFTVSDSLIYEISLQKGDTLWQKLIQQSRENKRLRNIVEIIKANIALGKTYTASQLLRKILNESPYLAVLARKAAGVQETANISKLVKLTIAFQSKGFKTLYDYVNFLKESIEETENEAQAAIADESDSVKVMTLHQAKGLEYPAVFLYNAHESTSPEKVRKRSIQTDKKYGLLTKVPLNNDYFGDYYSAPVNHLYDYISSKKEAAELKRLLYVGTTRAKQYLFISAPEAESYRGNSFMQLLHEGLNIDFSQDELTLKDELYFLKSEEGKFLNYSGIVQEKIKIRRDLNDLTEKVEAHPNHDIKPQLMISEVKDSPEGEFITATKYATFRQCPLKYQLKFEFGISSLASGYKKFLINDWKDRNDKYDFTARENISGEVEAEKTFIPPELKGSIIHKVLQENPSDISFGRLKELIKVNAPYLKEKEADLMQTDIFNLLNILFDSSVYKKIGAYKKSFNEYEIYLNEKDYFLHGIIDKLIIDGKKAVIVDYKTDDVQKMEIHDRAEVYFPQLKFYSYIVGRLFKDLMTFELKLIFMKFPDEEVTEILDRDKALGFGNEIEKMIIQLRLREFAQNPLHCKECNFALKNKTCIVDWV
jgi:ATP-dependent helicase/nuclease subunit A